MGVRLPLIVLPAIAQIIGKYAEVDAHSVTVGTRFHEDLSLDAPMEVLVLSQRIEEALSYRLDPNPQLDLLKIVTVGDLIIHLCRVA